MSVRLKWDQAKVYIRDASWHPRSDAGGKMPRYHFPHPDDVCMAACSPTRIVLLETSEAAPGETLQQAGVQAPLRRTMTQLTMNWTGGPLPTTEMKRQEKIARRIASRPSVDQRFAEFHSKNPHVADEMLRLARARVDRGEKRISVKALWEELRVSLTVTEASGCGPFESTDGKLAPSPYKLDNSLTALYARTIIRMDPRLADVIEVRRRRGER